MGNSEEPINPEVCVGAKVKTSNGEAGIVEFFYSSNIAAVNIKGDMHKINVEELEVIR